VVTEGKFAIPLTHDQALVLSDWLDRIIGSEGLTALIGEDRAVWSPIYRISGVLEATLPDMFAPDYRARLNAARHRLLATLGEPDPHQTVRDEGPARDQEPLAGEATDAQEGTG
jgi:hypothetical protein